MSLSRLNAFLRNLIRAEPKARSTTKEYADLDFSRLSRHELFSIIQHECHRIEKSSYNNLTISRKDYYNTRAATVENALSRVGRPRNEGESDVVRWARSILEAFPQISDKFVARLSSPPRTCNDRQTAESLLELYLDRRSTRVWAEKELQPCNDQLEQDAQDAILAASTAPSSGNRQPWRFALLNTPLRRQLLNGLKEPHCTESPYAIFCGIDTSVYGAFASTESAVFIDAGAAIMHMVDFLNSIGYGVCWNHLSQDLILSRPSNKDVYAQFCDALAIPEIIEPIAIVSFGRESFRPPKPPRRSNEAFILRIDTN